MPSSRKIKISIKADSDLVFPILWIEINGALKKLQDLDSYTETNSNPNIIKSNVKNKTVQYVIRYDE